MNDIPKPTIPMLSRTNGALPSLITRWLPSVGALWLSLIPAGARETPSHPPFTAPFAVRDGLIRDAMGHEVRLWGVNYYAPFAHNYLNIAEAGADYRKAIAEDVAQFRLLGLDFVRIHVYDREITDAEGHLTPNRHLEVFDLLLEELDHAGIFLMLTPTVWWNTPENQALMDRHYAYWHIGVGGSFGFSNFFGKDELIWNEDAIRCQEQYVTELLNRRSSISGRRYADFPNLVAIEPFNEPQYVDLKMLSPSPDQAKPGSMEGASNSGATAYPRLRELWEDFRRTHPGDDQKALAEFQGDLLQKYLQRMFAAIDGVMKRPYLRTHIDTLLASEPIHAALAAAKVDVYSSACYLSGDRGFDSSWTDHLNFLDLARAWNETMLPVVGAKSVDRVKRARADREPAINQLIGDRPRIIYEFDTPGTVEGYPFGAMALAFAARKAQMAAMFTYTPTAVAAYNPGWRVHYLNLQHTPARAVAFAAAGEIFRQAPLGGTLPDDLNRWQGRGWSIQREPDAVTYSGENLLIHSGTLADDDAPATAPATILASGSSRFVTAGGNGAYCLTRAGTGGWELTVLPNQKFVNDPFRGRSFRTMANRYININEWPVVSRLHEEPRRFALHLGGNGTLVCTRKGLAEAESAAADGSFLLSPGIYDLR